MTGDRDGLSRRELLVRGGALVAGSLVAGVSAAAMAQGMEPLDVASAGSMRAMLDGPMKAAVARSLGLDLRSDAQGADAVARSLVDGSLRADVFIPITAGPMLTVMHAGKAEGAEPIAGTEMVIVYSPKSRFAPKFEAAAQGKASWWEVLAEPGLRFARSDPAGDPGGRNIIFTMMLAAKKYRQPDLVQRVLGSMLNPEQVGAGGNTQAGLHSGDLDASSSYKVGPGFAKLPYVALPKDVNLSGGEVHREHPDVSLTIGDKTYYPEPLVFYAGILKGAANPKGAARFADWLKTGEAQGLLRTYQFDPAGDAAALHV